MNTSSITDVVSSLGLSTTSSTSKVSNSSGNKSFQSMLNDALTDVNDEQLKGYDAMDQIATGKVTNLQEAVQKMEQAELSMKLALEVKNKAINAYREVMKMQV